METGMGFNSNGQSIGSWPGPVSDRDKLDRSWEVSCSPEDIKCMRYSDDVHTESAAGDGQQSSCNRQKHSVIEKRRRKKMNSYISELSAMLPNCPSTNKLDKISVLRRTVQQIKSMQGATNVYWNTNKPPLVSDMEMKSLVEHESDGMLFVITCDEGKFVHASQKMAEVLGVEASDLTGSSIFEKLHSKDVAAVKEQLSYASQVLLHRSAGSPQDGISSGSWRSFFCDLKTERPPVESQNDTHSSSLQVSTLGSREAHKIIAESNAVRKEGNISYVTVHCTGFMKACEGVTSGDNSGSMEPQDSKCNCLILVGRVLSPTPESEFMEKPRSYHMRLDNDGRICHVDKSVSKYTGHLPQELNGTSIHDLFHKDDQATMKKLHDIVLQSRGHVMAPVHRIKTREGQHIHQHGDLFNFVNPWTNLSDHVMCKSTIKTKHEYPRTSRPPPVQFIPSTIEELARGQGLRSGVTDVISLTPQSSTKTSPSTSRRSSESASMATQTSPFGMTSSTMSSMLTPEYTPEASPASCAGSEPNDVLRRPDAPLLLPHSLQPNPWPRKPTKYYKDEGCEAEEEMFGNQDSVLSIALSMFENDVGFGGTVDFTDFMWHI